MKSDFDSFNKAILKANFYLKITGIDLKNYDFNLKNFKILITNYWFFLFNIVWMNSDFICEFITIVQAAFSHKTFADVTYVGPCATLSFLGNIKAFYFVKNISTAKNIIYSINNAINKENRYSSNYLNDIKQKRIDFLNRTRVVLSLLNISAVIMFGAAPLVISLAIYIKTGNIRYFLPFIMAYPFDPFQPYVWLFVYIHQVYSAVLTAFFVFGPDCFYYTCCTFIHIRFTILRKDIEDFIKPSETKEMCSYNKLQNNFISLAKRHMELIRCINLMETMNAKSTLTNFVSSSLLICFTCFNVMTNSDILIIVFVVFLLMSLFQIFLLCYYGDLIMSSSAAIYDAVYESLWYKTDKFMAKQLIIVLERSRKPCKLTAFGFADINLHAFTKVLRTSWSYFTLLRSMYNSSKN